MNTNWIVQHASLLGFAIQITVTITLLVTRLEAQSVPPGELVGFLLGVVVDAFLFNMLICLPLFLIVAILTRKGGNDGNG